MRPIKRIDDSRLLELHDEGCTFAEIGQYFGVSAQAAHKRYKKLKRREPPPAIAALTRKEKAFIEAKATGLSNTRAAMVAYDCKNLESAKVLGSAKMREPKIQDAIGVWFQHFGLGRDRRAQKWAQWAENQAPEVSMPALREVSKMAGDYPQKDNQMKELRAIYVVSFSSAHECGEVFEDPNQEEQVIDVSARGSG